MAPLKGELAAAQPLTEGFLSELVQTSSKPLRRFAPRQIVNLVQRKKQLSRGVVVQAFARSLVEEAQNVLEILLGKL